LGALLGTYANFGSNFTVKFRYFPDNWGYDFVQLYVSLLVRLLLFWQQILTQQLTQRNIQVEFPNSPNKLFLLKYRAVAINGIEEGDTVLGAVFKYSQNPLPSSR
jgi:hypothetical protein